MELGERHRARVEPGVDRLDDPAHLPAARFAAHHDLVDVRTVQVVRYLAAAVAQLAIEPAHQLCSQSVHSQIGSGVPQ